jgi:gas vesicle protein
MSNGRGSFRSSSTIKSALIGGAVGAAAGLL